MIKDVISVKKMSNFFQYYPAVLKKAPSIGYYIEYYAIDGTTNELRRQIVKLNRLKKTL